MTDNSGAVGDGQVGELRRRLRSERRSLSRTVLTSNARAVAQNCLRVAELTDAQTIGSYLPMAGELDPGPATALLGAAVFVPVVGEDFSMEFRLYAAAGDFGEAADQPLVPNQYGILEPAAGASTIAAADLDAVLVPLVGFDHNGHRIGMGGGYYDRAFAMCRRDTPGAMCRRDTPGAPATPVLVGVAHSLQQVDQIVAQSWDVPLDYIVTERELFGPFSARMTHE